MLYRLFYQMTRLTKDKGALAKEDRIDAVRSCDRSPTDRARLVRPHAIAQGS